MIRRRPRPTRIDRFAGLAIQPNLPRRLDRDRTASLAIPKIGVRERDEAALDWARNLGRCEVCWLARKTEPHHVRSVGAGGSDKDVIAVCRECHGLIHAGHIGRERLWRIIVARRPT